MSRRLALIPGVLLILVAVAASPVVAARPEGASLVGGRPLGMVRAQARAGHGGGQHTKTNNLTYHGGPVMHGNNVYEIFWGATDAWDSGYITTIDQYFNDVANDNGNTTNVYFSDTQYTDSTGQTAAYNVASVTLYTDTNSYPPNGCTDKATKICLTDAQLQTEIQSVMGAHNLTGVGANGVQNLFFLFTPKGVGSCYGSSCAYTTYCAYHSWMGSGSSAVLYANMPYANQNYRIYTCNSGQWPNYVSADATINLVSHEHNEAITDEQGNAWYDSSGAENGDKCAWNFGTASGPAGHMSNQTINGHSYYLQQEWSNQSSGCVQKGL
jgi:hypothetical protein